MTDNEIIKALECDAISEFDHWVIDLINRQKAEIERLEKGSLKEAMTFNSKTIANIKAEAVKEFAARLKEDLRTGEPIRDNALRDVIDNLVKEMVGEN